MIDLSDAHIYGGLLVLGLGLSLVHLGIGVAAVGLGLIVLGAVYALGEARASAAKEATEAKSEES